MNFNYAFGDHVANQLGLWGILWRQPHDFAVGRIGFIFFVCKQWHIYETQLIKPIADMLPRFPNVLTQQARLFVLFSV